MKLRTLQLLLLLPVAVGCGHESKSLSKSDMDALRQEFGESHGGAVSHQTKPVAQGPLPLVFMASAGDTVRVVDVTTGAAIASGVAARDSLVCVNANGVRVGDDKLHPGPLPTAHEFAIYLDAQGKEPRS